MSTGIPESMRAIAIETPGGPEVLRSVTQTTPTAQPDEVLIRVKAAGVNRPDCLQRRGMYPVPIDASPLPGLEVSGEIVAAGSAVTGWQLGDAVMALTHGGGYAEFCAVHENHCLPIPGCLSFTEAAAIPETFFTVWYNVFTRCRLQPNETFLVHGGSSGIGSTAIQLAKAFACTVITTAGSDEKCRFCETLGADTAINYRSDDWQQVVKSVAETGVDVLLDMVAGSYIQKNMDVMAKEGRYAIIAFLDGPIAELNMRVILAKRLTVTGSTLRPQSRDEKAAIASSLRRSVLPLLESEQVKPIIYSSYPLENAAAAHELMESSSHMGKIVLIVDEQ